MDTATRNGQIWETRESLEGLKKELRKLGGQNNKAKYELKTNTDKTETANAEREAQVEATAELKTDNDELRRTIQRLHGRGELSEEDLKVIERYKIDVKSASTTVESLQADLEKKGNHLSGVQKQLAASKVTLLKLQEDREAEEIAAKATAERVMAAALAKQQQQQQGAGGAKGGGGGGGRSRAATSAAGGRRGASAAPQTAAAPSRRANKPEAGGASPPVPPQPAAPTSGKETNKMPDPKPAETVQQDGEERLDQQQARAPPTAQTAVAEKRRALGVTSVAPTAGVPVAQTSVGGKQSRRATTAVASPASMPEEAATQEVSPVDEDPEAATQSPPPPVAQTSVGGKRRVAVVPPPPPAATAAAAAPAASGPDPSDDFERTKRSAASKNHQQAATVSRTAALVEPESTGVGTGSGGEGVSYRSREEEEAFDEFDDAAEELADHIADEDLEEDYFEEEEEEEEECIDPKEFKQELAEAKLRVGLLDVSYKGIKHDGFRRDAKLHNPKHAKTRADLMAKLMAKKLPPALRR